jgi:hypothetical protein
MLPACTGRREAARRSENAFRAGLAVDLGCSDAARLLSALAADHGLVHALNRDAATVAALRKQLRELRTDARVSVDRLVGSRLPYADGTVNLLFVRDASGVLRSEMLRVLAPGGVLMEPGLLSLRAWTKPRPPAMDEWTHSLYDASNNAVSRDRLVGPPYRLRWLAGPSFARSHEHLGTVSAVVSAGGRLVSIVDEGPTASVALPAKWRLVARDAYNGVVLWKRQIGPWESHLRGFRGGPPEISRRLVAVGDRVYVTLGYGQPVSELNAVNGRTVRTFDGTHGAFEIVRHKGRL